jgi:hypothetical protein
MVFYNVEHYTSNIGGQHSMATIHLHMELLRPQHNHQKELCVEANQNQKKTKGNPFCLHKGLAR